MTRAPAVGRGKDYLRGMGTGQLKRLYRREPAGRSREALMAAWLRRKGWFIGRIADHLGRSRSTIHDWLLRMAENGTGDRHPGKSTGRIPKVSGEQCGQIASDLCGEPAEHGFERSNWTASLLASHILAKFGVRYGRSGALALAHRLGFSVRKPRPVPHDTAPDEAVERYEEDTAAAIALHVRRGYGVYCMDAAGFANSPSSAYGIRPAGGHETVGTNFSMATAKAVGALGYGTVDVGFYDGVGADSVIDMLGRLRAKYGRKIFVILDNAGAHKSKRIKEYLAECGGDVVLWYTPPHTPQQNPIEVLWRELKRAVAGRYFEGGLEQMKAALLRLLENGEVAVTRLFGYMRDAIRDGLFNLSLPALPAPPEPPALPAP